MREFAERRCSFETRLGISAARAGLKKLASAELTKITL
jgi:hypothetical protein